MPSRLCKCRGTVPPPRFRLLPLSKRRGVVLLLKGNHFFKAPCSAIGFMCILAATLLQRIENKFSSVQHLGMAMEKFSFGRNFNLSLVVVIVVVVCGDGGGDKEVTVFVTRNMRPSWEASTSGFSTVNI